MRYVSIDCEMTGLNVEDHDILEFGAVIDNLADPQPIEDLPRYHCYFVKDTYSGSAGALAMHPIIFNRIDKREAGYTYISPMKFGNHFKTFLLEHGFSEKSGRVVINAAGKNFGRKDAAFLEKHTDLHKHVRIRTCLMDPAILFYKEGDTSLPGLEQCKKRAHIYGEVAHTAIEDALDVIKLLRYKIVDGKGH